MRGMAKVRWQFFLDWLGAGVSGTLPQTLTMTFGEPVWLLLPLARQAAEAVGPWLIALLAERERAGLAPLTPAPNPHLATLLAADAASRPLTLGDARQAPGWLIWQLAADLARLARLVEAPSEWLDRPGWVAWEVRYWALVIALARLARGYAALARQQGTEEARQRWEAAAAQVWQQTTEAA
jgi:hypothetical protein